MQPDGGVIGDGLTIKLGSDENDDAYFDGNKALWVVCNSLTINGETDIDFYKSLASSGGTPYAAVYLQSMSSTAASLTFNGFADIYYKALEREGSSGYYTAGIYFQDNSNTLGSKMTFNDGLRLTMEKGKGFFGIANSGKLNTFTVNGNTEISLTNMSRENQFQYGLTTIYDTNANLGKFHLDFADMYVNAGKFDFNGDLDITVEGGNNALGMRLVDSLNNRAENREIINVEGKTTVNVSGASEYYDPASDMDDFPAYVSNYGIYLLNIGAANFNDADITTTATGFDSRGQAVRSYGLYTINSNAAFAGPVVFDTKAGDDSAEISALAEKGSSLTFSNGLSANGATALRADASTITAGASANNMIYLSGRVEALNKSTISLNQKDGAMQLQGDIISDASQILIGDADSTGISQVTGQLKTASGGSIDGVFTGAQSFYRNVNDMETGHVDLSFSDSAQWQMTGSSEVSALTLDSSGILDMTYDNAGDKFGSFRTLSAASLSGEGGLIHMNIDAGKMNSSDRVYVTGTHTGEHYLFLNNVNSASLTDGADGTVLVSVGKEEGKFSAPSTEGKLYWNRYELGDKESATDGYETDWYLKNVVQEETGGSDNKPTTSVEAGFSANALGYHTWRTEMDSLMQRMGDLRQEDEPDNGAWFRVKGGKINRDGAFGFENEYVMYQLGYDDVLKRTDKYTSYIGVAFSYTDGEGSYYRGDGENEGKEFGLYYTKVHDNGHYLDVAVKAGRWDNDFDATDRSGNRISGDYDNNSFAFSAEYGRKIGMGAKGWYIEPQAQLSWGYFSGADYKMSNGVSVHQSGISSLLGRVGFNIGRDINKYSNIYLKANLYHEFCGDYTVSMDDGAGNSYQRSDAFDDTWFEYGVGAAFKWGEDARFYIDAERSAGSDFEKEWTVNAGFAWTF